MLVLRQSAVRAAVLVVFAAVSSGTALATTFLDRFVTPLAAPDTGVTCKLPGCGCADLGGEWSATCTVNGKEATAPTKLSIQQKSCQGIVVDGETLPIGGQHTETLTTAPALCYGAAPCALPPNNATTGFTETTFDWNKEKTQLVMHQESRIRVISGVAETSTVDGTLSRDGDRLQLDVTSKRSDGTNQVVSCTFAK